MYELYVASVAQRGYFTSSCEKHLFCQKQLLFTLWQEDDATEISTRNKYFLSKKPYTSVEIKTDLSQHKA